MSIMFKKSPLSRAEREMIAVVVSAGNNCEYCQIHHAEALNHYWKNDANVSLLRKNYEEAELTERQKALCAYAFNLPTKANSEDWQNQNKQLKNKDLSDREILDATLVISYFNFVNRIVLSLGVNLEHNPAGYNY
jgi:uncharacterized peroxidase-related enzyme